MIDFHSHILPDIDDGAKNLEESLKMLKVCAENGVKKIVLTPHCYHTSDKEIKEFIRERNEKYRILKDAVSRSGEKLPELLLGCELHLNKAHANSKLLDELAIEGTNYIMLEMPVGKWKPVIYDTIYSISLKGLRPIMAHIDRYYLDHKDDFHNLFSYDLTYQVNCDSFLIPGFKKKMPYFFECGAIHILGSDMHNLKTRTTQMKKCSEIIKKKYGEHCYRFIQDNSKLVLDNKDVHIHSFGKMSFWQRIKL